MKAAQIADFRDSILAIEIPKVKNPNVQTVQTPG
jgi:hypothetical protein